MNTTVGFRLSGVTDMQKEAFCEICQSVGLAPSNDPQAPVLKFEKTDKISVTKTEGGVLVTYSEQVDLFRALSFVRSVFDGKTEKISEGSLHGEKMLCYMADMSRNAVYNISSAKRMIRYLALIGFNSLMLYTEDTYEIPEYPYFGHMRGRFSKAELKEIDDYAFMFGIEVIPCVQALAHLTTALRWPDFGGYCDTGDILMVGDSRTYKFVESILNTCAECFRSRRINLGMDEAHMLGRGNYLTKNGYRPAHELMLEHLEVVADLCEKHGFSPMIWSDMFFRMAFGGIYRVREGEISPEIMAKVPKNLTLIYWDYYSLDRQIFTHMLECHRKFDNPIVFAGGAWKWSGFAPHNRFSLVSTEMQLDVCREMGVGNMIVTGWGDNGGEASQFAPLPVLLYFAESAYGEDTRTEWLESRSDECFGIGYDALLTLDAPNELPGISIEAGRPLNPSRYLLYNDPLEGLMDRHMDPATASEGFSKNAERLRKYETHKEFGYMYSTLASLCDLLSVKCDLSIRLRAAYNSQNKDELSKIRDSVPGIIEKLNVFIEKLRYQWYFENKVFGFANTELRLGGLRERLGSLKLRLDAYLIGSLDRIEELEQPCLPLNPKTDSEYICYQLWATTATVGVM